MNQSVSPKKLPIMGGHLWLDMNSYDLDLLRNRDQFTMLILPNLFCCNSNTDDPYMSPQGIFRLGRLSFNCHQIINTQVRAIYFHQIYTARGEPFFKCFISNDDDNDNVNGNGNYDVLLLTTKDILRIRNQTYQNKSSLFLTPWPWPETYDLGTLIKLWCYYFQKFQKFQLYPNGSYTTL